MNLTIRLLGTEILHISTDAQQDDRDVHLSGGTTSSYPVGFVNQERNDMGYEDD